MYAITYEDDGPIGACGQAMSVTSRWRKLFLFTSRESMQACREKLTKTKTKGRKNPRIVCVYCDGDIHGKLGF